MGSDEFTPEMIDEEGCRRQAGISQREHERRAINNAPKSIFGFWDYIVGDYVSLARGYHTSSEIRESGLISPTSLRKRCVDAIEKRLGTESQMKFPSETRIRYLYEMITLAQGDWNDCDTIKGLYRRYGEIRWPYWDRERRKAWDLEKLFQPQD